eukprot:TRINITY_DN39539_c0_g1_i2.p1 TRINITY_DN39539_c0_g1~~TRINITY_DN39539_c0_g1_i2.p1  ORF type:complete len:340 (-),score=64.26 TRINITY_DN39539_c0_g1_i2:77-1096(-)
MTARTKKQAHMRTLRHGQGVQQPHHTGVAPSDERSPCTMADLWPWVSDALTSGCQSPLRSLRLVCKQWNAALRTAPVRSRSAARACSVTMCDCEGPGPCRNPPRVKRKAEQPLPLEEEVSIMEGAASPRFRRTVRRKVQNGFGSMRREQVTATLAYQPDGSVLGDLPRAWLQKFQDATKLRFVVNKEERGQGIQAETLFQWHWSKQHRRYGVVLHADTAVEYILQERPNSLALTAEVYIEAVVRPLLESSGLRLRLLNAPAVIQLRLHARYDGDTVTLTGKTSTLHRYCERLRPYGFVLQAGKWVLDNPTDFELDQIETLLRKYSHIFKYTIETIGEDE